PEIADLLRIRSGRILCLGRVLADPDEATVGLILHDLGNTPRALAGRDGMVFQPRPDSELEEVLARAHRGVDELIEVVVGGDGRPGGRLRRGAAGERRGGENNEGQTSHGWGFLGEMLEFRTAECSKEQERPGASCALWGPSFR